MKRHFAHILAFLTASVMALGSCGSRSNEAAAESPADTVPAFSADSAMAYLRQQTDLGPRCPGHPGHDSCPQWLADELRRHGADTVVMQRADLDGFGPMVNVMGRFNPSAAQRILLLAHWDTRPWADNDPAPANHATPIDGANDGASGVAVLLEAARLIGHTPPQRGVDILFVDAEDSGQEHDDDSWARGAQYFAQHLPYASGETLPAYAVLLDMVGGRDARFYREMFSQAYAPSATNHVWNVAASNGLAHRFPSTAGAAVNDDHLPLIQAGIPAVDIIETLHPRTGSFNPTWHTLDDTADNIDPRTLADVGRLITLLIYE